MSVTQKEFEDLSREVEALRIALIGLQGQHGQALLEINTLQTTLIRLTTQSALESAQGNSFPLYDSSRMSADHFIQEVEEHLTAKGVDRANWLATVDRMFAKDSDNIKWWRITKPTIQTWKDFTDNFRSYETGIYNKDQQREELFSMRQKIDTPFETYAWDLFELYRKVDSSIGQEEIVSRIMSSCLPELAIHLAHGTHATVAELIIEARRLIVDLNKVRRMQGKSLLRSRKSDPIETNKPLVSASPYSKSSYFPHSTASAPKYSPLEPKSSSNGPVEGTQYCHLHRKYGHTDADCRARPQGTPAFVKKEN